MSGRAIVARLAAALACVLVLGACGAQPAQPAQPGEAEQPVVQEQESEQTVQSSAGDESQPAIETPEEPNNTTQLETTEESENTMERITITVNGQSFEAQLEDSDCGRAFAALLPTELEMSELNGNEKYCYTGTSLPTSPACPGSIEAGDLMLYGSDCVVLFYKSFDTSYSCTRIGRITNPAGIAEAVGAGSASVTFEARI